MNQLLFVLLIVSVSMSTLRMLHAWLAPVLGQPFRLFNFKSIFASSAIYTVALCFLLFRNSTINVNPPILMPFVALIVVAVVFAFALLGGYLGECVADFAIEKGQIKKR